MHQHPIKFFDSCKHGPREQQTQVLEAVYANWDKYDYFVFSLPTGVGKTYVAAAIADSIDNAYILTPTLQLQDQYLESWASLINLKGRSNYSCGINKNFTVDAAPCSANKSLIHTCRRDRTCPYENQKRLALASRAMITNPLFMLYSTHCGFAKDETEEVDNDVIWVKRSAVIFDEAHTVENSIVSFSELNIDPELYHRELGVPTLGITFKERPEENYELLIELYEILQVKAVELRANLEAEFPQAKLVGVDPRAWASGFTAKVADKVKKLNAKIYQLDKLIQPLKIFFNTHGDSDELVQRWMIRKDSEKNLLKLAPILADFLFHEYFGKLGQKFVFLSATLGSKEQFCKELGIPEAKCFFMETESSFDPKLSPIVSVPALDMRKPSIKYSVQYIGGVIDDLLDRHEGEQGVIHCITYDLQDEIFKRVSSKNRRRFLCRDMDLLKGTGTKRYKNDELNYLHSHEGAKYGSVLLSPSMTEGIDLRDALATFQIVAKMPWPNLTDLRVKLKQSMDQSWYANKMWIQVMQACGRATRHDKDTSVTYVIDSNFPTLFLKARSTLPKHFTDRVVLT